MQRLRQRCEEEGIRLEFKSPWKTSQRCPLCGEIERRSRNGSKFKCVNCGFEADADLIGALNLRALGLAGAYSLGSLKRGFYGCHESP
ncbi:MAG: zinc ribbon domain-containing protein [Aquificaceae bacterium]